MKLVQKSALKPLKASIKHWEENLVAAKSGGVIKTGMWDCALCKVYFEEEGGKKGWEECSMCPIQKDTGVIMCQNTPYHNVVGILRCKGDPHTKREKILEAVRAELGYLENLYARLKVADRLFNGKTISKAAVKALEESVAKGEANVEACGREEGIRIGWRECPLCMMFNNYDTPRECQCVGCPIFADTCKRHCGGTPYEYIMPHSTLDEVQRELDYLKALLIRVKASPYILK